VCVFVTLVTMLGFYGHTGWANRSTLSENETNRVRKFRGSKRFARTRRPSVPLLAGVCNFCVKKQITFLIVFYYGGRITL